MSHQGHALPTALLHTLCPCPPCYLTLVCKQQQNCDALPTDVVLLPLNAPVEAGKPFVVNGEIRSKTGEVVADASVPVTLKAVTKDKKPVPLSGTTTVWPFDGVVQFEDVTIPEVSSPSLPYSFYTLSSVLPPLPLDLLFGLGIKKLP